MDNLPIEVIRLISLELNPLELSINKIYYELYSDHWYNDYLVKLYPNTNMLKQTTYKDLYIKYLLMGKVHLISCKQELISIDSRTDIIESYSCGEFSLSLTINGDLIIDNEIIMTDIVAADTFTFVTKNSWFYIDENYNIVEICSMMDSYFITVKYDDKILYALTKDYLYYYQHNSIKKLEFDDAVNMCIGEDILVLQKDNKVFSIKPNSNEKTLLFVDCLKLLGNAILLSSGEIVIPLLLNIDITKKTNYIIPFKCTKVINYYNHLLILYNNILYIYSYSKAEISKKISNIKNICGNYLGIFVIK